MTISVEVEEGGHTGLIANKLHKSPASTRDDEIDELVSLEQRGHSFAISGADRLHRIFGKARSP